MPAAICPICQRAIPADAVVPRPFCSARCRTIDLGSWLDGKYHIGAAIDETEDEALPAPEPDESSGS